MKRKTLYQLLMLLAVGGMILHACKKEEHIIQTNLPDDPFNPYDTIDYSATTTPEVPIDSHTFLGLHQYIFAPKCAQPACHDGAFEPDFRTVQSAYNTLVYHPVVKYTIDSFFTYRVVPNDTAHSWMHERVTTDDPVLGRMPLYDTLPPSQIRLIEEWIMNGAPDYLGNMPTLPDYQPTFFGILGYLPSVGNMRVDTNRVNDLFFYPFVVPQNVDLKLWFGLVDVDENGDYIVPAIPNNYSYNKVKFSVDEPVDFSNATEKNLVYEVTPSWLPSMFGINLPYFYHVTINTGQFNVGDIVYVRVYVQDQNHSQPTELPGQGTQFYLQTYFSFIVQ